MEERCWPDRRAARRSLARVYMAAQRRMQQRCNDKGTRASAVALIALTYSSRSVRSLSRMYCSFGLWLLRPSSSPPPRPPPPPPPLYLFCLRSSSSRSGLNISIGLSHPRDTHLGIWLLSPPADDQLLFVRKRAMCVRWIKSPSGEFIFGTVSSWESGFQS